MPRASNEVGPINSFPCAHHQEHAIRDQWSVIPKSAPSIGRLERSTICLTLKHGQEIDWENFVEQCLPTKEQTFALSVIPMPFRGSFHRMSPAGTSGFFAAVFLRLLSVLPQDVYELDNDRRVRVTILLGKLPEVAQALNIDSKYQSYERLRALESGAVRADESLAEAFTLPEQPVAFDHVRQRIMRVYRHPLVRAIARPFLPDFLSKLAIDAILGAVHRHLTAGPRVKMTEYTAAKERLEAVLDDCTRYDTRYVAKFFQPFFTALLHQLTTNFETSSFNLPGDLSLRDLGKKYPFTVSDAEVRLAFAVKNKGSGMAFDVELSLETDDCLSLNSPSQFFDQVDSGESFEPVEFPATVVKATDTSVIVVYTLRWTNGDGSHDTLEDLIELPTQPSNIPWDTLKHAEPYSLEPVSNANELIGRSEQTRLLISKLKAQSVGSFCIYGQKRVGKTSVVTTLEDMPEVESITILYLDTGMFIVPDARETINNLGMKICTVLLQKNPRLAGLTAPHFNGALSPLDDFLTAAFGLDPALRLVVVLDEFDALPSELYRRGNVSHAFFMTLRSLSARRPLGFILVGGEGMSEILSTQGEVLNKFRPLRIDYLERQSQWSDFVELVRRPVEGWATITDEAVTKLYDVTAGNPFFTKFICTELVEDMKRRRDAYVTGVEMDRAIRTAVNQAAINHFQHFWDDGVIATTDERIDQERASRRRVMLALGEVLRSKDRCTIENISTKASRFGLGETEVRRVLADFEKRKILVQAEEEYSCKVRLFERWLVDEGVNELDLTLVEEESLRTKRETEENLRVKDREISTLVDEWGSYRGRQVTDVTLKSWLDQFETAEDRRVVFKLLKELRFYSGGLIREKLRIGHNFVRSELAARGVVRRAVRYRARKVTDNILISFFGGEGKRGQTYAKLYADENKIYHNRITTPERLRKQLEDLADVSGIVFVDDFIGTGRTAAKSLKEALSPISDLTAQLEIDVFLISVSGFAEAAEKVERDLSKVSYSFRVSICDPLGDSDKCFSERSEILPDSAKRVRAREIVESYGKRVFKQHPLGFGNCQALIVFENTCPNNSLPILWAQGRYNNWRPLFSRP